MLGCSMAHIHYLGKKYDDAVNVDDEQQGPGLRLPNIRGLFEKAVRHVKGWSIPVGPTAKPAFA